MVSLGLILTLFITMIIQQYRRIVTHCKYVHNAFSKDALSVTKNNNINTVHLASSEFGNKFHLTSEPDYESEKTYFLLCLLIPCSNVQLFSLNYCLLSLEYKNYFSMKNTSWSKKLEVVMASFQGSDTKCFDFFTLNHKSHINTYCC